MKISFVRVRDQIFPNSQLFRDSFVYIHELLLLFRVSFVFVSPLHFEMSSWNIDDVKKGLNNGTLHSWKKSSTRSKEWDSFQSIFTKDGDETSQIDFIVCMVCNKPFRYKSTNGNGQLINHNKFHFNHEKQVKMTNLFMCTPTVANLSVSDQQIFNGKIANFVAGTISPFSITESSSFKEMINFAFDLGKKFNTPHSRLNIISKKSVKKVILDEYERLYLKMDTTIIMTNQNNISLTIDIWTDNAKLNSYIDISVLFVRDFSLQNFQYEMIYFPMKHTSENIKKYELIFVTSFTLISSELFVIRQ